MDGVVRFIRGECKISLDYSIQKKVLYEAYYESSRNHGEVPVSLVIFCRWLNQRFSTERTNRFNAFRGITLRNAPVDSVISSDAILPDIETLSQAHHQLIIVDPISPTTIITPSPPTVVVPMPPVTVVAFYSQ